MGVDYRKAPPLPAPTESESVIAPTETAQSDLSKVADDESHYSLPDDGTPVTIRTRGHRANKSQTSLLIEYFEGGKATPSGSRSTERKPSVRVRLTPSKTRGKNDHIQITETRSSRSTPLTKRAIATSNLTHSELDFSDLEDADSMRSYASATEESNVSRNPIEVDIDPGSGHSRRRRKVSSPLIPAVDSKSSAYFPANISDISAIPTDSFLDGSGPSNTLREDPPVLAGASAEKTNRKQRASYHDQNTAHKSSKPERKHRSKNRTSTASEKDVDYPNSPRRKSKVIQKESVVSAADSSVLSSQLTPSHRSYDSHSSSRISINNPKLLETVEDAIRRLILPELDAIKRERSQRETKGPKDRGSISSLTSATPEATAPADKRKSADTTKTNRSRDREARNDLSPHSSIDQFSYTEDVNDDNNSTPRLDRDLLTDAALGGAVGGGVGAAALRSMGDEKRQRRRRRAETPKREHDEKFDGEEVDHKVAPPMPLQSEINPSEITRTSILSADTDRPHSASEQMMPVREVARGVASMESMDDATTPTRSPVHTLQNLGTQHANVSHGDLRALPRKGPVQYTEEYDEEGYPIRYPSHPQDTYDEDEYDEAGHLAEPGVYEDESSFYGSQDVPAPLRYVPYQQERRGLSPIQSVSGYTEGESEVQGYRDSRITQTASELSSPSKSPRFDRDLRSQSSIPSNLAGREFGDEASSVMSSGIGYRNTVYTDNSEIGPVTSGQAVKAIKGNPEMVHQNSGPESAVASLIDPSMLSGSANGGQDYRDSQLSYIENIEEPRSRGMSPAKRSTGPVEQAVRSPSPSRERDGSAASHQFAEYELNEYGQKVPQSTRRQSPTTSESAITAAALSRAAALKRQNQGTESPGNETGEEEFVPEGVSRNRSFKERAKNGYRPDATPRHSVDRLYDNSQPKMGASGLPDFHNPDPALGYGYDDDQLTERRTPSVTDERFGKSTTEYTNQWSARNTPTQEAVNAFDRSVTPIASKPGVAVGATPHSRQPSQEHEDEWQRTSGDRKRDTLVTNPYEGTSPIANLPGIDGNMLAVAGYGNDTYRGAFHTGSPGLGGADEGYISAAPNEARGTARRNNNAMPPPTLGNIDDPFYAPKDLRLSSGMSQGMQTPLFDSATGTGIDRIQSTDIIALMEHLMVRDAQRSARDTEILVTLVRSAAEMRNSFDDIKKMLADTEDAIVADVNANTEKTIKRHLGGPRPFPGSSARSIQGGSQTGTEDLRTKKRNLLRRALQGLSAKGNNDLGRIEDMLIQLLTDVDVLKHQTAGPVGMMSTHAHSMENLQPEIPYEQDRGYEPEGNAGTSTASHASQSGHLSIPQSRGASMRAASERKFSDHRISTVQEDDGEYEQNAGIAGTQSPRDRMLSPPADRQRGGSVPLGTPPQTSHGQQLSASSENTPRTGESKKHKSKGSSSFFPKISRWSETTTSSIGKVFRSSGGSRKQENTEDFVHQPPSRSGSDLAEFDPYQHQDPYGDDKLHFSPPTLLPQGMDSRGTPRLNQQTTAPMAYATPEDPKYRAHRDSLNLQHPQPRPGQMERFRTALETSAADYDSPMSPRSADWAGSVTSLNRFPQNTNRYSDNSVGGAGVGADEYNWAGTASPESQAPARPPKEPLDTHSLGAQTPPQNTIANKLLQKQGSPLPYQSVESGYGTATATHVGSYHSGSPRLENRNLSGALGVPTRRPSGPRAMTPSRSEDGEKDERRRKRDTFGTVASPSSALSQESETF
ncbi:hypothetical protein F4860DRAFT_513674 [Xylaria cubensis]|nr:hypothetical protein F4860DRAFT_513674 [Xylaria cubensis]